jgi:hypothetical protein
MPLIHWRIIMSYIVWVGGVAVFEGDEVKLARKIFNEWIAKGYDDVALEKVPA